MSGDTSRWPVEAVPMPDHPWEYIDGREQAGEALGRCAMVGG